MAARDNSLRDENNVTEETSLDGQVLYSRESIRSDDLFGYGRPQHSKTRVKLIYDPSGDCEEAELTLEQSEVLMLKYAAVVSRDIQNAKSPTFLEHKLLDNSMNTARVDATSDPGYITVSQDADTDIVQDADDFKDKMVQIITSLSTELCVKLVEIPEDKYVFAIKHLRHVFQEHPTVRMYTVEPDYAVAFVVRSMCEDDVRIVDEHIKVTEGEVQRQDLNLNEQDQFKLNVLMEKKSFDKTNVDFHDDVLSITGFAEDVQESVHSVTKKLRTYSCEIRKLETFAVSQIKEKSFVAKIDSFIRKKNWKVGWKMFGEDVVVVGMSKQHVELATDLISGRLATIRDEIDLALYRSLWERDPRTPEDANPAPVMVIKTTPELVEKIVKVIAETGDTELTVREKGYKWSYFLKLTLKEIVENYEDMPFSNQRNAHCDEVVILKGSKDDIGELKRRLQDVHVEKLWIRHERNVAVLNGLPDCPELPHIRRVKKGVAIRIIFGRIEQQQVDVIVNSAGPNLGDVDDDKTLTTSILKTAGDDAKACFNAVPKPIAAGNVIMGDPGKLPCKKIQHAFLARYNNEKKADSIKLLYDVVHHCLAKTLCKGYQSIALPALCAGVHQYPVDEVVETMLDAIINFINGPGKVLDSVCIVCRQEDKKKAFDESVKRRQEAMRALDECLMKELPWPTSHYCCIVAETEEMVSDIEYKLKEDLSQQTIVKSVH